ncbi:hypothetical protein Dimus_000273 [Dionaea muscipula]
MVSKRQKLARKRYKEAHPELFPNPEPTLPKDPNKKKKNPKFKRKKSEIKGPKTLDKAKKSTYRKHPLRIPGLKPGEACFICKANDHIAKNCPEKTMWEKNKICLLCRHRGHSMKNCPNKQDEVADNKMCYNCGETGHSLSRCPKPLQDGGTKFAHCFICKGRGHLSRNCPQNAHGIYPKGGCCKVCGDVTHLVKDCPNKGSRGSIAAARQAELKDEPRGKVTKFISGDDLEDDFKIEDKPGKRNVGSATSEEGAVVRMTKKQAPKVVNFVG